MYSRPVQLLLVTLALCSNLTNSPESNVIHTHQKSPTNELNRLQRHPLNPTLPQPGAPICSDRPARAAYVHHTATSCLAALAALPCRALSKLAARVNAQCITYQDKFFSGDVIVETEFETVGDANLGRGKGEGGRGGCAGATPCSSRIHHAGWCYPKVCGLCLRRQSSSGKKVRVAVMLRGENKQASKGSG